jgi:hypothetical protein
MAPARTVFVQTIETNSLLYDYSETPSLSSKEEAFLLNCSNSDISCSKMNK